MTLYMLEELEELLGSKPSIQRQRKARMKTAWTNLIRQYRLSLHECTQSFSVQLPLSLGYCVVLTAVHYAQPGFKSLERISLEDCFTGISHLFPPQFRFPPCFYPTILPPPWGQDGCEQTLVLFSVPVSKLEQSTYVQTTHEVSFSREA